MITNFPVNPNFIQAFESMSVIYLYAFSKERFVLLRKADMYPEPGNIDSTVVLYGRRHCLFKLKLFIFICRSNARIPQGAANSGSNCHRREEVCKHFCIAAN